MAHNDNPASAQTASSAGETAPALPGRKGGHEFPEQIGPFRILEVIGLGGMGIVYKAEQREPVRRVVALKVIKLGMDTDEVVARFEAERQALAMMSHPNVAAVYQAGVTEQGRPYFAMEYVPGIALTDYCDQNRLTMRQRLALFIPICQAVQHAHQKGIIHRDLKPTNILVTLFDGKPIPKVIDFGIAKAANQALTQKTLFTQTGALIGTPEYMSPEQAQTSGLDVDTRTDVYSLGIILYELLTGQVPFDSHMLRRAGLEGMARIIRETEPPRPSTRLSLAGHETSSSHASYDEAGHKRRVDPKALVRQLRGDLDWIVLKAIEKDRTRRYETANALAVDVSHYLESEPISARPPSTVYRLGKMLRKHKVGVAAIVAIALAMVAGIVGTSIGLVRARAAAREAQSDRNRALSAGQIAIEQRRVAEQQRALAMESEARADVTIAHLLKMKGDLATAESMMRQSLAIYRQLRGPDHVDIAAVLADLAWLLEGTPKANGAQQAARESLAMYQRLRGEQDPLVAGAHDRLGIVLMASHEQAAAETELRHSVEIYRGLNAPDAQGMAAATGDLGALLQQKGDSAAEPLLRESLQAWITVPGYEREMRHDIASIAQTLERMSNQHGDQTGVQQFRRQYLIIQIAHIGMGLEASPDDTDFRYAHAQLCFEIGRVREAMADYDKLISINRAERLTYMQSACGHLYLGDAAGYQNLCRRMLERDEHTSDPRARDQVAKTCLLAAGAVHDLATVVKMARTNVEQGDPKEPMALFHLCAGMAEYRAGNYSAAADALQKSLDMGVNAEPRAATLFYQAMTHFQLHQEQQAQDKLQRARQFLQERISPPDATLISTNSSMQDWLICQIAAREADELIQGKGNRADRK